MYLALAHDCQHTYRIKFQLFFSTFNFSFIGSCWHRIEVRSYYWDHFKYPGNQSCYSNNKDCTWLLETTSGYYIRMEFYDFHLQYGSSYCPYDYVEIYDRNSPSHPLITRACGQLGGFLFYSSGRFLLVSSIAGTKQIPLWVHLNFFTSLRD